MKTGKFYWRINHEIRAPEVRVIASTGKQQGVMKLGAALEAATKEGLDLVEIAPHAKPPVVKIVDLGKFKYQQEKKLQKEKRAAKAGEMKEVRLSPFIANHDYQVRLTKIRDFLGEGYKVRIVVVFLGRQLGSKQFGYDLLRKVNSDLGDGISTDLEPKFLGRHLTTIVSPTVNFKKGNNNAEIQN